MDLKKMNKQMYNKVDKGMALDIDRWTDDGRTDVESQRTDR